jgi:hypothetical protein
MAMDSRRTYLIVARHYPWKSECHGGEVESKNGFEEHHSARGRSKKLSVGKVNLVREGGTGHCFIL